MGCNWPRKHTALLLWLWQLWSMHEKISQPIASTSERDMLSKSTVSSLLWKSEPLNKENTSTSWICCIHFTNEHDKFLEYCLYFWKISGIDTWKGNLARRTVNIQNFDPHHICLSLHECEPTSAMSVIPSTDEKNISLSIGVLINFIKRKNGTDQKISIISDTLTHASS